MEQSVPLTGVIVADDDAMVRSVLRASLEAINLNVFVAHDGLEAVWLAARIQAALIILDLKMPKLNGLLACQCIRAMSGHTDTPIVILTSTHAQNAETAAVVVGATDYHMKPFRTALLMQALSRFLPLDEATRRMIRRNADRVSGIAEAAPTTVDYGPSVHAVADGLIDRGKCMLDLLRR